MEVTETRRGTEGKGIDDSKHGKKSCAHDDDVVHCRNNLLGTPLCLWQMDPKHAWLSDVEFRIDEAVNNFLDDSAPICARGSFSPMMMSGHVVLPVQPSN